MRTFDIKTLEMWESVGAGEVLEFDNPGGARKVALRINATGPVAVYAGHLEDGSDRVLLGAADGMFAVTYSTDRTSFVSLEFGGGVECFVTGTARSQVIEKTADEVFTSVEPSGRRNSDYDRMVHFVKLNERRRDAALAAEIAALRAERKAAAEAAAEADAEADAEIVEPATTKKGATDAKAPESGDTADAE